MTIRQAQKEDVISIVAMLADDELGRLREDFRKPLPESYYQAFQTIYEDPHQSLMVMEKEGQVIGTLQLTLIPYLTYQGGIRAQIEAVRIHKDYRGQGIGEQLFRWAIAEAQRKGAHLIQLTTDKKRPDALRFYEKLGFKASHEGMKLHF
ncbi:MAG: GNAT family N-acetyltransferase [Lewinella sp.]|uniref:GNAT family N-acetyltransferase n=1 Tax=Lewinella sp. TaxID=2004506 RepID=UPI003D6B924C